MGHAVRNLVIGMSLAALAQSLHAQRVDYDEQTAADGQAIEVTQPPARSGVTVMVVQSGTGIRVSRAADGVGRMVSVVPLGTSDKTGNGRGGASVVGARGGYGYRIDPILGSVRFHAGTDLASPAGTRIIASARGVVSRAGWVGGYGLLVTIDHGNGVETRYAHLSRIAVSPGQKVVPGDLIGLVGSTGRSTGPHLHYEVRHGGRAVSPKPARVGQ